MTHLTQIELVMALDGEMEPRDAELAMRHMELCAECRNEFEKLGGVSKRVEAYQQALYAQPLSRVVQEQRLEKVSSFRFRVSSWGLAVAAVVLLGISVAFWDYSHGSNAHPIARSIQGSVARDSTLALGSRNPPLAPRSLKQNLRDKGGAQASVSEGESNERSFVAKGGPQDDNHKGVAPASKAANVSRPDHPETAANRKNSAKKATSVKAQDKQLAQFTELPFSDASLPLDEATVVRVELPAAALRQAGVPVEEDNASAMLQADVVLGVDGLPRGIRLVKNTVANHAGTN